VRLPHWDNLAANLMRCTALEAIEDQMEGLGEARTGLADEAPLLVCDHYQTAQAPEV